MPSAAAALVATLAVGFGAPVAVRVAGEMPPLAPGSTVGGFLVAEAPRPVPGGAVVVLRPLALGTLAIPLPGDPDPDQVEVVPTLAPGTPVAPVVVPAAPAPAWLAPSVVGVALALAAATAALLRRRRPVDPVTALERGLRPFAEASSWGDPAAADALAHHCRAFLARATGAPCAAMTTRELLRLIASRTGAVAARPFALALVLADEVRYTGSAAPPDDAALLVRDVLRTAPTLTAAGGGAR